MGLLIHSQLYEGHFQALVTQKSTFLVRKSEFDKLDKFAKLDI